MKNVIIAGLVVGGGVLVVRALARANAQQSAAEKEASKTTPCDVVAGIAGTLAGPGTSVGINGMACSAINAIGGAVLDKLGSVLKSDAQKAAENRALNGAVSVPLGLGVKSFTVGLLDGLSYGKGAILGEMRESALAGDVALFSNGCQPFAGAPGWSRCAKGTHDMGRSGFVLKVPGTSVKPSNVASTVKEPVKWSAFMTGLPGDPTTHERRAVDGVHYVGGKPFQCSQEQVHWNSVADNRDGAGGFRFALPACGPAPVGGDPNDKRDPSKPLGSYQGTTSTYTNVGPGNVPAGYVWCASEGLMKRARKDGTSPCASSPVQQAFLVEAALLNFGKGS